ncbi:hypothetical protein Mlute_01028 [Meiothermus luteus]|uniref:Glyoxalase-like domain protein n=1 Tax=Meiothermus luteus TaxID=2026184 RepID=A0A399EUD4_9DEIN|nr:glyoxalase/bleomycin resistance/dioxygenase family protein [Meiothermus luteus]RIH87213.1 hypothetical protein Mlute_01028 [Meiothermus luteus]RMH54217.1 MAG: glyoxalase/bleomycin resistance/dioxygenase family protein [Deinococcota bacterium]
MVYAVSRVWLAFPDLERAAETYARLGFWVIRRRPGWAQIFLADGVVLELFSLAHLPLNRGCGLGGESELLERRRRFYEGKKGLLDYALSHTASLVPLPAQLEQRDIPYEVIGERLLPQMVLCPPPLPLWLEPPAPLPVSEQTQHPNGVTGLHALVVGSPAYPAALAQHRRLLGPPLGFENHEGQRRAVFAVGHHFIYLQGAKREGLLGLILRNRYALWGALEAEQTLGVLLTLVGDPVFELAGDSAPDAD